MNIAQAKEQIKRAVTIYLMKDEFGNYRIPLEKQRPIFMIGAPGIGKTAIVSQIAEEMNLACISYSMTHHTRQSAIGLPFIEKRTYEGKTFDVSVYTLSEIIASVYETMKASSHKEGILFLDEINCVSETLAPGMLQFLQYKTFGNHKLPEGWVIVTAGNPSVFNRSARSFDIATLDRLKVLPIEADYEAWKAYALTNNLHRAVSSYLDVHQKDLFHIESTVDGKSYVTPRGWEDLSQAMLLYEETGFPIDESLIGQYLHDETIAGDFAAYYSLYKKYKEDYHIVDILDGKETSEIDERMEQAQWDEKISVTDLLLDGILPEIHKETELEHALRQLHEPLKDLSQKKDTKQALRDLRDSYQKLVYMHEASGAYGSDQKRNDEIILSFLNACLKDPDMDYKKIYGEKVSDMHEMVKSIDNHMHHLFTFLEKYASQQELLLVVTQLTIDHDASSYIAVHGSEDYYHYNDVLMTGKRNAALMEELEEFHKTSPKL